jgi:hypothetical protein
MWDPALLLMWVPAALLAGVLQPGAGWDAGCMCMRCSGAEHVQAA